MATSLRIRRKLVRWILGNPLIAITMMRHDVEAGLFAPVELLLRDHENDGGSTVVYDLSSSLTVIHENPPLLQALWLSTRSWRPWSGT